MLVLVISGHCKALEKGYIHDEIFSFNGLLDESIKPEMNYERIIKKQNAFYKMEQ